MKVKPLGYHILVQCPPVETETAAGIVKPDKVVERERSQINTGIVLAFGKRVFSNYAGINSEGTPEERAEMWGVKIGDNIQFAAYQGHLFDERTMETDGDCRVLKDEQLICVLED